MLTALLRSTFILRMRSGPLPLMPSRPWRAVAPLAIGLVMLLMLSAVSPALHAWLHPKANPHQQTCAHHESHAAAEASHAPDSDRRGEHECAVTMFSQGAVVHGAPQLTLPCERVLRGVNLRALERVAWAEPRFLHLPPQAPPAV